MRGKGDDSEMSEIGGMGEGDDAEMELMRWVYLRTRWGKSEMKMRLW